MEKPSIKDIEKEIKELKKEIEILSALNKQFGVKDIPFKFYFKGKNKIYAYCAEIPNELKKYCIHSGIYIGKLEKDGIRLSIDGASLIGKYAKKGILEVDDETAKKWMEGKDLQIEDLNLNELSKLKSLNYIILKWREFYIGCGKLIRNKENKTEKEREAKEKVEKVKNYVPKNRRIK